MIGEHGDLRWWGTSERAERAWQGEESSPLRGLCAGLAAGLLATLVMDGFSRLVETTAKAMTDDDERKKRPGGGDEPATAKLGRRISRTVMGRDLDDDSAQLASEAVHYGYGTLMGGLYGLLGEVFPRVTIASGAPWGAALFLLGDEVMVPALGLAKRPREVPVSTHARAFGAHLLYGTTLDLLRRGILACIAERDVRRDQEVGSSASSLIWIDSTELETGVF